MGKWLETKYAVEFKRVKKSEEKNCIATLRILSGGSQLEEMPHKDTLTFTI